MLFLRRRCQHMPTSLSTAAYALFLFVRDDQDPQDDVSPLGKFFHSLQKNQAPSALVSVDVSMRKNAAPSSSGSLWWVTAPGLVLAPPPRRSFMRRQVGEGGLSV